MIATLVLYDHIYDLALTGGLGLESAKLALIADTYTPNAAHAAWSDVSAHEVTGPGYTAGGAALGGTVAGGLFSAAMTVFSALEATFAYGVLYSGTDLIGYMMFSGGNSITTTGYDFEIVWNVSGIIEVGE